MALDLERKRKIPTEKEQIYRSIEDEVRNIDSGAVAFALDEIQRLNPDRKLYTKANQHWLEQQLVYLRTEAEKNRALVKEGKAPVDFDQQLEQVWREVDAVLKIDQALHDRLSEYEEVLGMKYLLEAFTRLQQRLKRAETPAEKTVIVQKWEAEVEQDKKLKVEYEEIFNRFWKNFRVRQQGGKWIVENN